MKKKEKWFDSSIMRDDSSKTTENTKHFVLNNGTRKALFFPQNMNYHDPATNEWKPIDNSLTATDDGYHANLGRYTAKLSKNTDNETIEISSGSNLITWEYLGINKNVFSALGKTIGKTNPKSKSKLNVKTDIKDNLNLAHASRAIYSGAEGNVDLDYLIEGNGIKENIVIKEKSDSYHYYFLLRVAGFEMKTADDGIGLEFYKPITDTGNAENRIPEFIMPAPFMYDTNGDRSNNVKYVIEKIENGVYIFSIEADSEWINASNRVFPVCIDPQLLTVTSSHITVTHDSYQWCDCSCCSDCSCYESYWMHTGNPYYPYIYLYDNGTYRTTAKLRIKKSGIDLTRNRLISAKLIFQQYSGQSYSTSATVRIGNSNYTHYNNNNITANITSLYNSASGDFTVDLSMNSIGKYRRFYIPTLQIEYQPICDDPIRKTFSVETGANAELDVLSGNATVTFDDISDPVLGVAVSHVYKPNDGITEYGQNFRLNLNEKLVKTSTTSTGVQYAYTDAQGDVHTFKEHFYRIGANGEKVYITSGISSITADADGRLWLSGTEVFRELTTDRGLQASARLEGIVNNAEWVEQRIDEEKQAEEQMKSYKNTLCNFVSVNKETGAISSNMYESMLSSPDSVESFLNEIGCASHLLLSKEEALSYKSLLTQKESLNASKTALTLQKESLKNNAKSLLYQHDATETFEYQRNSHDVQYQALQYEKQGLKYAQEDYIKTLSSPTGPYVEAEQSRINYYDSQIAFIGIGSNANDTKAKLLSENLTLINEQEVDWAIQKEHIKNQIRNFPGIDAPSGSSNGTLTKQYNNTQDQINVLNKQLTELNAQINLYAEKSAKYIPQFKSYYKEYLNLKNQLDKLKMQVPVAYLISDNAIKGFNSKGELVIVQDKYGKYVVVEHDKYNTSGKARASSIYDQDGRTMTFAYNGSNKLSEICNTLGERVAFEYDPSGYLTSIKRDNQPSLTLSYTTVASIKRISKITSSNNTSVTLSYNLAGMLTKITRSNTAIDISHDNVVIGSAVTLSTVGVEYTSTNSKLIYDNIKQEIYTINPNTEQVTAHYEIVNGKVTGAERYTYNDYLLTKTECADKSCLGRYSFEEFAGQMQIETVEEVTYNSFKEPVVVVASKYAVPRTDCDCPIEQTTVEYTYNDSRKLTEKKTTHCYCDCCEPYDITVAVEKYYYDTAGELVRKEAYVEGEELKIGINIEEHVFNDKGVEIKSFSYNSLDPSSKFYTENEVDENGKVLSTFDESGEHKTVFDYERNGATVKTERLPNGSKFSYGRDKDGTVSAITHSTETGEENSTTQLRTLDAVTEVKSGNNTVRYAYDKKRRVKAVSLNGVDDYVTYTYSGEHTDAEKVTATMADGTTVTTTKNAHGNVTKSTVGNKTVTNTYDADQQLTNTVDSISGETSLTYDDKGKVISVIAPDHSESFVYDDKDLLTSKTVDGTTYEFTYKATADKALDSISVNGNAVRPNTDALGRNTGKVIEVGDNKIAEEKISYVKFGDHATNMSSNVRFATNGVFNESIQYKYDSMGNIIEVFKNGRSACRYEYDSLGRLTREDNVAFGKTTIWAYDNNGNILARYEYAITTKPTAELHLLNGTCKLYTYDDNSDQLMSYNGEAFDYDIIGNPTTYRGKSATWAYGRQLTAYDGNIFAYDARGRRTAKNGITFTYDSNGNLIKQSNGLEFLYDHTGVFAVKHNNATYFYRKDAQANIVALLDNNGSVVVKYKYDAWGKCVVYASTTNTELANLNPFRYRSYYFDTETSLYFLKTRYYDPEIGRFMTIDDLSYLDPDSINGLNLYAYCFNNPVMMIDDSGCAPAWWQWLVSGLTLAAGIALCFVPGGQVFGVGLIVAGASGLISNTMDAIGVDGKIATLISSGLSIVSGIALCFTPFAGIGAGLIGQGVGSIAGGYISEALGGSFEFGAAIGGIAGSLLGGLAYRGITSYRLSHMSAYEKGVMGERYVKALYGNKVYKPTTGSNRPDLLFKNGSTLIEVKNVASQSMTRQLNRYLAMNVDKNIIYVRLGTKVSSALKNSAYTIKYFPW